MSDTIRGKNLPWHVVERSINSEIEWLKNTIDFTDTTGKQVVAPEAIGKWAGDYYLYRLIAILIVSGQIRVTEINSDFLWGTSTNNPKIIHRHGKEWHRKMMDVIDDYFSKQDYDITVEPQLHHGRADLGVFKGRKKDLYVEVGTTSIYKLCINLYFMRNFVLLIVPKDGQVIEFVK